MIQRRPARTPLAALRLRSGFIPLAALTIIFVVFAIGPLNAAERIVLQLRWEPQFQFAGYYAALWQGYYAEAGLEVEIRPGVTPVGNALNATQEVAEGRADFGIGTANILVERDKGAPLVIAATVFQQSAAGVIARADTNVRAPADLAGLRVRRFLGDLLDMEFLAMLRAEGVDIDRIDTVLSNRWDASSIDLLAKGEIDAYTGYTLSAPWLARQRGLETTILRPAAYGVDFYGDSLFTTERLAHEKPDLVKRFVAASRRGWRYAMENADTVAARIANETQRAIPIADPIGLNRYQVKEVRRLLLYPNVQIGHVNPMRWEQMHLQLQRAGLLQGEFDRYSLIFDPEHEEEERRRIFLTVSFGFVALLASTVLGLLIWNMTLRRQVAARTVALRDRESRLRRAHQLARMGHWDWSAADDRLTLSTEAADILGVDRDSAPQTKRAFDEFVDADDRIRLRKTIDDALTDSGSYRVEYQIVRPDGECRTLYEIGQVSRDPGGNAVAMQGTLQDITESKRAERELAKRTKLLETIFEVAPVGISLRDRNLRYVYANKVFAAEYGLRPEELIGRTGEEATGRELQPVNPWTFEVLENGTSYLSQRSVSKRLSGKPCIFSMVPVEDEDGNRQILTLIVDTSERDRLEKALIASEATLRNIIDNYPCYISLKDLDGRYLLVNEAFAKTLGVSVEEATGMSIDAIASPDDIAEVLEHDRRTLARDGPVTVARDLIGPNGERIPGAVTKFPVYAVDGKLVGIGTISADIREQREVEEQLRQSRKMEAIGQLTGGVSHDFNNLLGVIIGNLEMLEEQIGDDEAALEFLEPAKRAALSGAGLTRQLLAFSRKQRLSPELVDVNALIADIQGMLRRTLGERVEIVTKSHYEDLTTKIDPGQLESVLLNLAVNARDAMPEGGKLTMEATTAHLDERFAAARPEVAPGEYVLLTVADTGTGMAPEVLSQVFEPFFTTKGVGEGSGLGLSMVFGVTKQSGGHIEIESEIGKGTLVKLYFPRVARNGERRSRVEEDSLAAHGETLLLVEDNPDLLKLSSRLLRSLGYGVITANDAQSALSKLNGKGKVDLLLTDIVMPGDMDGRALAHEVAARYPHIKILYMTGYASEAADKAANGADSAPILQKPFRRWELARQLRQVLERRAI